MTSAPRRCVTIAEACRIARVSRRTIHSWVAAGRLEYVRTAGGRVRIFADTLLSGEGAAAAIAPASPHTSVTAADVERMIDAALERFRTTLDQQITRRPASRTRR